MRGERLRTYAALYSGGPPKPGEIQTALGTLRAAAGSRAPVTVTYHDGPRHTFVG